MHSRNYHLNTLFLIYPYWNIKNCTKCDKYGFLKVSNLSILEYKDLSIISNAWWCIRFLIYPYWNIKKQTSRNKVSIKWFLIYPYWNIKYIFDLYKKYTLLFLIYPYWNIKSYMYWSLSVSLHVSNLSILEYKALSHCLYIYYNSSF